MTDTAITRLQNHLRCDLARKNRIGRACVLKRFSQWLWSVWMIDSPQTSARRVECTDRTEPTNYICSTTKAPVYTLPAPEQPVQAPPQQDQPCQPCKACKAWGVPCDQVHPRCSHCLEQQILCFYVAPTRKSTRKSTRSTKPSQVVDPTPRFARTLIRDR
ncbi:uncharacterized protein BO72DRAFT_102590 [Aspergillus fijiensis CBS 313.89]|uniref:Zn(2)-C6 fungal-type domain-containing protein n=1 Tax=Aspergillus fijiensis CBS 313.89 TaxID=1448319 RepID=A0A8G1RQK6_9EURO|nr:uncharacterized protein BO72DRAFT_102590 [Aspergillus fijiensis CBS 313.89]RAK77645.1 hypothetical protein BO72DRAFT_102590 [Aspergillus fijiensis CBS 313.89]